MRTLGKAVTGCLIAGTVLGLVACGSSSKSGTTTAGASGSSSSSGKTINIYSSLPLQGATSAQTLPAVNGMKLALSQAGGKAGQFTVKYTSLDDSTAAKGNYDLGQCAANARKVATDSNAVAYLGEFNSGCTEVSLPILNQSGLPMISPANTYVGLTTNQPSAMVAPGEPQKYYPTGQRTYLRIVPRDSIQGAADLLAMKQAGCTKVAEANDKTPYGAGIAQVIQLLKGSYGVNVVSNTGIDPTAPNYRSYAATIKGQGADCFFFGGVTANGGVQIVKDVHAAIPTAKIFGPDGVCTSGWTNAKMGGVPAAIDPLMHCTVATLDLASYPGGTSFLSAYKAKYGVSNPDPYAIYGYEDMKLVLDTVKSLGAQGNSKSAVLKALFAIKSRPSVLGTYGFDKDGDTTLKSYGYYKVGPDGNVKFDKTLTPKVTS
jgi:branched-chain amino acid transport system substrate-binding protein